MAEETVCDEVGKRLVHELTNHLQVVIGFLELNNHARALAAARVATDKCRAIVKHCSAKYHPKKRPKGVKK